MSNKTNIQTILISKGFQPNYIERAFKVYEKNYGLHYNVEVLTEIISRLHNKDKAKKNKTGNKSPQQSPYKATNKDNNNNDNNKNQSSSSSPNDTNRWVSKCRQMLIEMESKNIKTRATFWSTFVNEVTKETMENIQHLLPESIKSKDYASFIYRIADPLIHLQFLSEWTGLKRQKITKSYKEFESKAKNWMNGRKAPNYAVTLYPSMIHEAELYATEHSERVFPSNKGRANVLNTTLRFGYLARLCSAKISLSHIGRKIPLLTENSTKSATSNTSEILQSYAIDHPQSQQFPTRTSEAATYFEGKYQTTLVILSQSANTDNNGNGNNSNSSQRINNNNNSNNKDENERDGQQNEDDDDDGDKEESAKRGKKRPHNENNSNVDNDELKEEEISENNLIIPPRKKRKVAINNVNESNLNEENINNIERNDRSNHNNAMQIEIDDGIDINNNAMNVQSNHDNKDTMDVRTAFINFFDNHILMKLNGNETERNKYKKQMEKIQNALNEKEKQIQHLNEMNVNLNKKLEAKSAEFDAEIKDKKLIQTQLVSIGDENKKLKKQIEENKMNQMNEFKQLNDKMNEAINALNKELEDKNSENENLRKEIEKEKQNEKQNIDQLNEFNVNLNKKLEEAKVEKDKEMKQIKQKNIELINQIEKEKEERIQLKNKYDAAIQQNKELQKQYNTINEKMKRCKKFIIGAPESSISSQSSSTSSTASMSPTEEEMKRNEVGLRMEEEIDAMQEEEAETMEEIKKLQYTSIAKNRKCAKCKKMNIELIDCKKKLKNSNTERRKEKNGLETIIDDLKIEIDELQITMSIIDEEFNEETNENEYIVEWENNTLSRHQISESVLKEWKIKKKEEENNNSKEMNRNNEDDTDSDDDESDDESN